MATKIDRDDYVWMGDHHFNGNVTGITAETDNITGLIEAGDNVTIDGDGTSGNPYIINATGETIEGVQSVTGDGVNNSDPGNPVISYPSPEDIGAVDSNKLPLEGTTGRFVSIAGADGSMQDSGYSASSFVSPDDLDDYYTKSQSDLLLADKVDISDLSPNAATPNSVVQRTSSGQVWTVAATVTGTAVNLGQMNTALSDKISSVQQEGVGIVINNLIQVTQAEYDGLTPQAGTFYAIVG